MRSDLHGLALMVALFVGGLALFVAGFVIALEVRSAVASPSAAASGGACYTNWNGNTCAGGYAAVETGVWTIMEPGGVICATEKTQDAGGVGLVAVTAHNVFSGTSHMVNQEPCAICCAVSAGAVGGIAEYPDIAGTGGGGGYNYVVAAVVAAGALVVVAAGGWYARRRSQG